MRALFLRMHLATRLSVDGIPKLVLLNPDGTILSVDGRDKVIQDPQGANFPWAQETEAEAEAVAQ